MTERVTCSIVEGIADVRLNRPDKLNALDKAMFEALVAIGDTLAADRSLRAVVVSGEGRAFCAGLDFSSFAAMAAGAGAAAVIDGGGDDPDDPSRMPGRITHMAQQVAWAWQEIPVPVIAVLRGVAYGGGLQIALGADIRYGAPDTRLSVMELKWGLIPDMTGTQTLIRLVGLDVAKELTFTARVIAADEALRVGLVTRIVEDPLAAAFATAEEIAAKSPHAIRAAKRLLGAADQVTIAQGLRSERNEIASLIGSPNQVEAVIANLEKRPPRFADPT